MNAACDGHLDWLRPMTLVYISGSPCPDYSRTGLGHGASGRSGRLGDPTSRRRVFLFAIRPECIVDGKDATDFFTVERTSSDDEVTVATCLDSEPEEGL